MSWDLRLLVPGWSRKLILMIKMYHIYMTHPQKTLPPCLTWLYRCIFSYAGHTFSNLSAYTDPLRELCPHISV